jgi:hypothetical protein
VKSLNSQTSNTLQKLHSIDYIGEWINVELSKDRVDRRFIKPKIIFQNPSGNAICLGNGNSRTAYSTKSFENTNKRKILRYYNVMYGCNAIYRDWQPDFLLITNQLLAASVPADFYSISFAPQEIMRRYKGMNLMPGGCCLDAGSNAAYLAAFHGAKRVFLYGYDGQPDENKNNNIYADTEHYSSSVEPTKDAYWVKNLRNVIETYNDVEFLRVTSDSNESYRSLLKLPNYKTINFRQFISLADL